jgi:FAD/FMN-containing dehydrogenase
MRPPSHFRGPFRTDEAARALYAEGAGVFRIVPQAVAVPAGLDDVLALVRWAAETGTALTPRGSGSAMAGQNVGPGVVVDLSRAFPDAPVIDADRATARVGASVIFRDLNIAAGAHGLRLPPDPSSGAFCTIGGMAACNAAGSHTMKYGAMRRWVRTLDFVTADGESGRAGSGDDRHAVSAAEHRFWEDAAPELDRHADELARRKPHTRKNSSGYAIFPDDLPRVRNLLIGSEGTLAILTHVEVALAPLPAEISTLLVTLRDLADVAPAIDALEPFAPAAVELLDRTYLDFVRVAARQALPEGTEALLLVELENDGKAAEAAVAAIASSVVRADDPASSSRLWETRHLASPLLAALPDRQRSLQVVEDGCVPRIRLGDYITGLRARARAHGFEVVIFGHAGDGHIHANLLADVTRSDVAPRLAALLADVSGLQADLGGTLAGEHGDGRLRAPFLERLYGTTYVELCRRVKRAFDPRGILNPGVKLDAPELTGAVLKVGPDAPDLGPATEKILRAIEKDATWATFRLDLAPAC